MLGRLLTDGRFWAIIVPAIIVFVVVCEIIFRKYDRNS